MIRVELPFDVQCRGTGLPVPAAEFRFHPSRKWRVDWMFVDAKLAVEVEGGYAQAGRHTRAAGFLKDLEKYGELAILGYRLLRVTPRQVKSGEALRLVTRALTTTEKV